MENFFSRIRRQKMMFKLPKTDEVERAISAFSKKERYVFIGLALVLVISTLAILENINKSFMVSVPMRGGSLSEGIVGTPRFINPILAVSDADRDLTALIYSGLMRKTLDGSLAPDLAEKYNVSADGLTYTFTLKNNIYFQDGKPVTADDVVFTINSVKDPIIKSPLEGSWGGISVAKIDDKTIQFTLKQTYASFLENLTLGIMPAHIWNGSPIELSSANTNPIGSGPYQVSKINKESSGTIDSYQLSAFKKFVLAQPYLQNINLYFYSNENDLVSALESGAVDQASSITPEDAGILREKNYRIESSVLPRIFGLFFNQNQNQIFTDKNVVQAFDLAIDKNQIISEVLNGYGVAIDNPIPPNMLAVQTLSAQNNLGSDQKIGQAKNILAKDGWKKGASGFLEKNVTVKNKKTSQVLQFSISTGDTPELAKTAQLIQADLQAIGVKVDVQTFAVGDLNQLVIRPRKYDALLFGEIINQESDLLAFWHSSQRKDPGLNVAMYTNPQADKLLEEAFVTTDVATRTKYYTQFEADVRKDMPAVFLYSPDFIYAVSKNLQGLDISHITSVSDRFLNVHNWYTQNDNVWKIFAR